MFQSAKKDPNFDLFVAFFLYTVYSTPIQLLCVRVCIEADIRSYIELKWRSIYITQELSILLE